MIFAVQKFQLIVAQEKIPNSPFQIEPKIPIRFGRGVFLFLRGFGIVPLNFWLIGKIVLQIHKRAPDYRGRERFGR